MARDRVDLRLTPDGDLAVGLSGDIRLASGRLYREQQIRLRLLLASGEWRSDPLLGADLESLRGLPNRPETAQQIVDRVMHALTYDGLFEPWELSVEAFPVSHEELVVHIEAFDGQEPPHVFEVGWHLLEGLKVGPV